MSQGGKSIYKILYIGGGLTTIPLKFQILREKSCQILYGE